MSDRYYVPDLSPTDGQTMLEGPEAKHLASVLRAKVGAAVELFNGLGIVVAATVAQVGKRAVVLNHREVRTTPRPVGLTLALALPKGARADWLVEKCTELGVGRLVPLATERSVVMPGATKLERLRRTAIEACKQCGRDWLPEFASLTRWHELAPNRSATEIGWLLHPTGTRFAADDPPPDIAAIGPEGGWTDEELELARTSGWRIVRLPGHILRVETAAVATAAWCRNVGRE